MVNKNFTRLLHYKDKALIEYILARKSLKYVLY